MGYYVVKCRMTFRELYITSNKSEAEAFKYNYEYSHHGLGCEIKYVDQKFEEFPKVLFVEAAGCYTVNTLTQYSDKGYSWIYDFRPPRTPLSETDSFMLSKDTVKVVKNESHTDERKESDDLADIRFYMEFYIKSIIGESPAELHSRIKSTVKDIIKSDLEKSGICVEVK